MSLPKRTKISLKTLGALKRRRKKRQNLSQENEEPPKLNPSVVYVEDPSDLHQRGEPMTMDIMDFWNFVDRAYWRGRLRICEGQLLQTLIGSFDDLAQNKIIGKVQTNRIFYMPNENQSSTCSPQEERDSNRMVDWDEEQSHVVRASFTYYGGIPLKKHRKVTFAPLPNSVYTPPIRHSLPIIKYTPSMRNACVNLKEEALCKLHSQYSSLFPRLHWPDSGNSPSPDAHEWFISPIPEDLANRCITAAQDFVVVKEQFTDSETWRTVTSLTFSRKERKWLACRVAKAMTSFYTSVDFPMYGYALEKRPMIPKRKGLMTMKTATTMKKYVVATSRNPQRRRVVKVASRSR